MECCEGYNVPPKSITLVFFFYVVRLCVTLRCLIPNQSKSVCVCGYKTCMGLDLEDHV